MTAIALRRHCGCTVCNCSGSLDPQRCSCSSCSSPALADAGAKNAWRNSLARDLDAAVAELAADELPALIATCAATQAKALARLATPTVALPQSTLVNAAEMARILGVPENWVRDRARAGTLPSHRLGHYRRFAPDEVLAKVSKSHDAPSRRVSIPKQNQAPKGGKSGGVSTLSGEDAA